MKEISAHQLIEETVSDEISRERVEPFQTSASARLWEYDWLHNSETVRWVCHCKYCGCEFTRKNFHKVNGDLKRNDLHFCNQDCRDNFENANNGKDA